VEYRVWKNEGKYLKVETLLGANGVKKGMESLILRSSGFSKGRSVCGSNR